MTVPCFHARRAIDRFIRAHLSACSASFALYTRSSRAYALRSSSTPSLARIVAFARATRTTSAARSIAIERAIDRDEGTARLLILLIGFKRFSVRIECLYITKSVRQYIQKRALIGLSSLSYVSSV